MGYTENELAKEKGFNNTKTQIGLSAQEVSKHFPECSSIAPFDMEKNEEGEIVSKSGENYLTLQYERLVPVLLQAIKELNAKVKELESKI